MKSKNKNVCTPIKKIWSKRKLMTAIVFCIAGFIANAQTSLAWAKQIGGTGTDNVSSVVTDAGGNVYTMGIFSGTSDMDPGTSVFNLTAVGNTDIFISKLDASGNFVWAKQFGGTYYEAGTSLAIDGSGNIYATGQFQSTVDFDPGTGTYNLTCLSNYDAFVLKLDSSGNFVWVKQFEGTNNVTGFGISTGLNGYIYVSGYFLGTVDFDPGTSTFNLSSVGGSAAFISKLDASGNFVWAKQISGSGNADAGRSISADASGNVVMSISFSGVIDFDPNSSVFNLTAVGYSYNDIAILKLDVYGNLIWAKQFSGPSDEIAFSVSVDAGGNVFSCGYFFGPTDFDPGTGVYNLTSLGSTDAFICKLDPSGNFLWAKQISSTTDVIAFCLAVDVSGNIYCTGAFSGTADFDPNSGTFNQTSVGSFDVFLTKLDGFGNFVWAEQLGGTSVDVGYSLTTDLNGNIFSAGMFQGTSDFDQGSGTYNLTSLGANDIFVHKLSQAPITQLASGSCGITETALDQFLYSDIVSGATDYRYDITGPSSFSYTYYRGNSSHALSMSWIPGVGYGVTYTISVAAAVGGTWTAYGTPCTVTTPVPPTTKLNTSSCGITETALDQFLYSDIVAGATNYRYDITGPSSFSYTYYRGNPSHALSMSWIPGVGYGVTYTISVAAAVGGTWTAYGIPCTVTTPVPPTTQLNTSSCGITETGLGQLLYSDIVSGATDYRYDITGPSSFSYTYYRGNSSHALSMSWIPGVGYGVTYTISVAAAVGGTWTAYGIPCTVTTPVPPTTQLNTSSCGITETTLSQYLYCNTVSGATDYRYDITGPSSFSYTYYRGNPSEALSMSWIPGIGYGVTYSIKVAAAVGGTWTAYGSACDVTTPASPKPGREEELTGIENNGFLNGTFVRAFPNPTNGKLTVDLESNHPQLNVLVTNSIGQELMLEKFNSVATFELNLDLPAGIYFIDIQSNESRFKKIKVIKQ
jgi:hypothetical protein